MKKLGLSLLFAMMMLMFATAASASTVDPGNNSNPAPGHNPESADTTLNGVNENSTTTGSGIDAANNFAEVIKSQDMTDADGNVATHKTHGEYQNNTNSCASCHQTHTAKARQLLFADSTYKTCAACHDGTLGFYNVFETGANASLDGGGTFGGSHANNMSMHQATGSLLIKAAPGGNQTGTGSWAGSFNCASCHAPHGSYSDRLLHYNPNQMGSTPVASNGKQLVGLTIGTAVPTGSNYGLVLSNHASDTVTGGAAAKVVNLYKGATKLNVPMLYGYASYGQPQFTRIEYLDNGTPATIVYGDENVYFNNEKGYFKALTPKGNDILTGTNGITAVTPVIGLAYVVKMDLVESTNIGGLSIKTNNQAAYWDGMTVDVEGTPTLVTGLGVAMTDYCAACHTDYLARAATSGGTKWSTVAGATGEAAYRHSTNSDRFTCVRCHFAHGTDAEIMLDASGKTVADYVGAGTPEATAISYMVDKNPSSALKKFTNMTVCWACHNDSKATTLKNTDRLDGHPTGMPVSTDGVQR